MESIRLFINDSVESDLIWEYAGADAGNDLVLMLMLMLILSSCINDTVERNLFWEYADAVKKPYAVENHSIGENPDVKVRLQDLVEASNLLIPDNQICSLSKKRIIDL